MAATNIRRRVFEEAEQIALQKGLDRLQARENAEEHLRFAALKLIEGNYRPEGAPVAEDGQFMLAYGIDKAQYDQWSDSVDWWDEDGPYWAAHRIRVVAKDGGTISPAVTEVMRAIGAFFVYHENDQNPEKPPMVGGVNAYHFIHPDNNEAVEDYCEWLQERHYQEDREEPAKV